MEDKMKDRLKEEVKIEKRDKRQKIGSIISGSLIAGLDAKLSEDINVENISVGRLLVIDGVNNKFFCLLKDVSLQSTNEDILLSPPEDDFSKLIHTGINTYYKLSVHPMLTVSQDEEDQSIHPSTTVPPHFSPVYEASEKDVAIVFGEPSIINPKIGTPIFMDVPVCLNLEKFCKRTSAIFGKSGSGKSVLARMVLGHLVASDLATNLIFDMHNEYGWSATSENNATDDPSLRQLLGNKIAIFTVDWESPLYLRQRPDYNVQIPYSSIEIADLELAASELGLTSAGIEAMYRMASRWGDEKWLPRFINMDTEELKAEAENLGVNEQALNKLHRCLDRIKRLPFISEQVADDAVKRIMDEIKTGRHVVIQFGRYNSMLAYLLVANIITRRLHKLYVDKTDKARAEQTEGPKPLVVTIEEAHKFLDPEVAKQTIFGIIAREMRKYNMVLMLIDQRPSGIYDEILSQVGTRIIGELGDEKDINAVLTGLPNQSTLKVLINNLEPRQFLLTGFALPMPVVIDAKDYRSFCDEISIGSAIIVDELENKKQLKNLNNQLYGDEIISFD